MLENVEPFKSSKADEISEEMESAKRRRAALRSSIDALSIELTPQDHEVLRDVVRGEFESPDPRVRAQASLSIPQPWNLDLIERLFKDPEQQVRRALLQNIFLREHFPSRLEDLYRDPSPSVREVAAGNFLLMLHRPDLVERYLTDPAESVRASIARTWNRSFGFSEFAARLIDDPSPAVQAALEENPWIDHNLELSSALGGLLPASLESDRVMLSPRAHAERLIDDLRAHAESPNPADRALKLHWMTIALNVPKSQLGFARQQAEPFLRSLASDPEVAVRQKMAEDFALMDEFPDLRRRLIDDPSPDVRQAVVEGWFSFRSHIFRELVGRYLTDPSPSVRIAMLQRWHPLMGGVDHAAALLRDPVRAVREAARRHRFASWLRNPVLRGVLKGWAHSRAQRSALDTPQET